MGEITFAPKKPNYRISMSSNDINELKKGFYKAESEMRKVDPNEISKTPSPVQFDRYQRAQFYTPSGKRLFEEINNPIIDSPPYAPLDVISPTEKMDPNQYLADRIMLANQ